MQELTDVVTVGAGTMPNFRRCQIARRTVIGVIALFIASFTLVGGAFGGSSAALNATLSRHSFNLSAGSTAYSVDYWSNAEIGVVDPAVRRVVVIVHGDSRNADDYGRYTASAATAAGVMSSTMVVAPQFVADVDSPRVDQLYWTADSWKTGSESEAAGRSWTMPSFRVMDAVLAALRTDYPTAQIVLAGHSAGGQFVQRYVASNGVHVADRYVPMNPGSYVYLDARRWAKGTMRALTAREIKACSGYDSYKYGLDGRPTSTFSSSRATVASTYLASPVTYLLGESDTLRDSNLDTGCSADWEGANRFERGTRFFLALRAMAGAALGQEMVTVPGVAHEGSRMIKSTQAVPLLFGATTPG